MQFASLRHCRCKIPPVLKQVTNSEWKPFKKAPQSHSNWDPDPQTLPPCLLQNVSQNVSSRITPYSCFVKLLEVPTLSKKKTKNRKMLMAGCSSEFTCEVTGKAKRSVLPLAYVDKYSYWDLHIWTSRRTLLCLKLIHIRFLFIYLFMTWLTSSCTIMHSALNWNAKIGIIVSDSFICLCFALLFFFSIFFFSENKDDLYNAVLIKTE